MIKFTMVLLDKSTSEFKLFSRDSDSIYSGDEFEFVLSMSDYFGEEVIPLKKEVDFYGEKKDLYHALIKMVERISYGQETMISYEHGGKIFEIHCRDLMS